MTATLYPGIPFSPQAAITNNIGAADSIIEVSDVSAFPPAPNLATIGTGEEGETILYTAKTGTALSGCQRGVEGAARAWTAGELIGRNFTAKDHADLIAAVTETREAATEAAAAAQGAAETAGTTAETALKIADSALSAAQAVRDGWSSPNLLDNWYFVDPINQKGKTEYPDYGYTIDRWRNVDNPQNSVIVLSKSGLSIKADAADGPCLMQPFEASMANFLCGKTFTLTMLWADGTMDTGSAVFPYKDDTSLGICIDTAYAFAYFQYNQYSLSLPAVGMRLRSASKVLSAIKMELGTQQTLAVQTADGTWRLSDVPDKAAMLRKCRRYFYRITGINESWGCYGTGVILPLSDGSLVADIIVPLSEPMCYHPSVSGTEITAANGFYAVDIQPIACVNISDTCACIRAAVPSPPDDAAAAYWLKQGDPVAVYAPPEGYIDLDANL